MAGYAGGSRPGLGTDGGGDWLPEGVQGMAAGAEGVRRG